MASVNSYSFNNLSRLGDDVCGISERDIQNNRFGSYTTQNFFEKYCGMKTPMNLATNQPSIILGSNGTTFSDVGGCNIDNDSKLRINKIQTNPKCRLTLQQRQYLTIPYLGKGPAYPVLESALQQASYSGDKKNCKNLTEKDLGYTDVELVPSLKANIQNPVNLVEGVAVEGWVRGGLPSRDLSRDNDYFKRN